MGGVKSSITSWANKQGKFASRIEEIVAGVIVTRSTIIAPRDKGDLQANGIVVTRNGHHSAVFGDQDVPYARRREFENKKNPQTLHYLKRGGDSVGKENIKKYADMA